MKDNINGFKIIEELPIEIKIYEGKSKKSYQHFVIAECKLCSREWKVEKNSLRKLMGCGCKKREQYKELPKEINGFKIIKDLGNEGNIRKAIVECKECKREYKTHPWQLINRKHCGCIKRGTRVSSYVKSHPRLVKIFNSMKDRCNNPNSQDYKYYGGKGIEVCIEWVAEPDYFCEWALNNGYTDELTIDRINNELGYSPENCRWETRKTQGRNRKGVIMNLENAIKIREEFAKDPNFNWITQAFKYGVSPSTIDSILRNYCWKE